MPKENLLEFKSEDGWDPLCKFLGEKVPEGTYPRTNDSDDFVELHKGMWWFAVMKMLGKVGGTVGAVAVGVGAAWYYGYMKI